MAIEYRFFTPDKLPDNALAVVWTLLTSPKHSDDCSDHLPGMNCPTGYPFPLRASIVSCVDGDHYHRRPPGDVRRVRLSAPVCPPCTILMSPPPNRDHFRCCARLHYLDLAVALANRLWIDSGHTRVCPHIAVMFPPKLAQPSLP